VKTRLKRRAARHRRSMEERASGAISAQDIRDGATVNMTSGCQQNAVVTGEALISANDVWCMRRLIPDGDLGT
jgi:flagella basal body P-ring formation protein FlgA